MMSCADEDLCRVDRGGGGERHLTSADAIRYLDALRRELEC